MKHKENLWGIAGTDMPLLALMYLKPVGEHLKLRGRTGLLYPHITWGNDMGPEVHGKSGTAS